MIFLEEEFRAFCATGEGGGIKNDCSASDGGGASVKADNSWKREQKPVRFTGEELKSSPPAKSLAGVESVVILDGELVSKSLREVGVTLDQAAKACAAIDPQSQITIAHGGMRDIVEFVGSEDPDRWIEDTVTFISKMPVADIPEAAQTAVSLTRTDEEGLVMSYTMLMISEEAKSKAAVSIARQMMKGTVASITQAEKIGVDKVEMLAAGSETDKNFRGYRIWPRLGFDGVIPRSQITPTWSVMKGFFNSYGSGIPDRILSPRARKEKSAGALTIQALYETKEGQDWWEKNGGEMEMSLKIGDSKSLGWKRFEAMRGRFSQRSLDLADAFFDEECRGLLDEAWVEVRAFCATGEGNGVDNSCSSSGVATSGKVDDSWKESTANVSLSGDELKERPPFDGAERAGSVDLLHPEALKGAMEQAGIESLGDLAAMGGGAVRGSRVKIFGAPGNKDVAAFRDAYISVENVIPLARDGSDSEGTFSVGVSVYRDGDEYVLGLNEMYPDASAKSTGERIARATSLMQQAVVESILGADRAGLSRIAMSAAGGPEYDLKGYRLWPQFGFDALLEPTHKHSLAKAPPAVVEKVMRAARPDLFATRVQPSHAALVAALPRSEISVQQLISFHDGDVWWDKNGTTIGMTLDLSDKKSLGYAKFQKRVSRLKRLKDRNQDRAFFEWLEEEAEYRAGADCGRVEGGRFGPKNDCAGDGSVDSSWLDGEQAYMKADEIAAAPPFKGAHVLEQFNVRDVPALVTALSEDFGSLKSVENIVTIGGGLRNNGKVSIDADSYHIFVETTLPVSRDGSPSLGDIYSAVTILSDDGTLTAQYDEMGLSPEAMSAIETGDDPESSSERRRIASLVLERMTESLVAVENAGIVRADTLAAGSSTGSLRGYRLWPQFGFDGQLTQRQEDRLTDAIEEGDIVLTPEQSERKQAGTLTVQDLIATTDGDRWWNDNGSMINLTLDFTDKSSPGYKRFERMKKMLGRLKERNKSRSAFEDGVEYRKEDCGRVEGGKFAPKNDCASEDGGGADEGKKSPKPKKDSDSIPLGNVRRQEVFLRGGRSVVVTDKEAADRAKADLAKNPRPEGASPGSTADLYGRTVVRREDTRRPNKITSFEPMFDESDLAQNGMFIAHESVGRLLSMRDEDARRALGGEGPTAAFDTRAGLSDEQFEYVVAALKQDVDRAYEEGRNPGFYSTDIAECMEIMSGFYPELKDADEAKRRGTTPEDAAFVFTMITAITSNGTDPALNLESADRIYRLYREHGSVRTPDQIMGGERANEIRKSLGRFQDMIDEFGESRVRSLLSGVTRVSTINAAMKRLASKSSEIGGSWSEGGINEKAELKDEVVPVAAIFGPKIGAFFSNLRGRHEFLTMDRWLMRSVGRVTGELLSRSTPEAANKQANAAIKAIKAKSRSRDILFGVDKPPLNLTREDVIRSLELQARTGIVEESGAAYEWAKAAQRSYNKTPKGEKNGETFGSFGEHPDPQIHAAHKAGNVMFKTLVHEQQDPRSPQARRVLRGVFREVARRVAEESEGSRADVQVSEIQAVLWQYEQNLWKRLGAKTKIEGDSLYSAAAKALKQRRDSGEAPVDLNPQSPRRPKSVRSYDPLEGASGETDYPNQSGQDLWDDESELAGVDFVELLRALAGEVESRSLDCGRNPDGTFAQDNDCGGDGLAFATVGSPSFTAKKGLSAVLRAPEKSIQATLKQSWASKKYHIAGSIMRNVESRGAEKTSRDVLQLSGYTAGTVSKFAEEIQWQYNDDVDAGMQEHDAASTAAGTLSMLAAAARVYPAAKKEPFVPLTRDMVIDEFVADGMKKDDATAFASQAAAFYSIRDDKIFINLGTGTSSLIANAEDDERKSRGEMTHLSSTHFGHTIVHEIAHKIHFQHLRSLAGIKSGVSHDRGSPELAALMKAENDAHSVAIDYCKDNSLPLSDIAAQVSAYATESPSEFVAEYYAGVVTGVVARTPLLDGLMAACNFPMDKMPRKKK